MTFQNKKKNKEETPEAHAENLTSWNRWLGCYNGSYWFANEQLFKHETLPEWKVKGAILVVEDGFEAVIEKFGLDWGQVVFDCAKRQAGVK